jgi:dipeptidyl-peptidase-4
MRSHSSNMSTAASTAVLASNEVLEMVASRPLPGMVAPSSLSFSPDSSCISFLQSPLGVSMMKVSSSSSSTTTTTATASSTAALTQQLYAIQLKGDSVGEIQELLGLNETSTTSEAEMSLEEKLRRERQRNLNLGITSYSWGRTTAKEGKSGSSAGENLLLIPLGGDIFVKFEGKKDLILAYDHNSAGSTADGAKSTSGPCLDGMFTFFFLYFEQTDFFL